MNSHTHGYNSIFNYKTKIKRNNNCIECWTSFILHYQKMKSHSGNEYILKGKLGKLKRSLKRLIPEKGQIKGTEGV